LASKILLRSLILIKAIKNHTQGLLVYQSGSITPLAFYHINISI